MKKILLPFLFLPLMFGVSGKNSVKTESFVSKSHSFALRSITPEAQAFLDYWVEFRTAHEDVCDITQEAFSEMYFNHYLLLNESDRQEVLTHDDVEEGYTIKQIIESLKNKYYPNNKKVKEEKQKLNQSSIIVIASVVALVGATAISVLFILKNNKVIK